MPHKPVDTELRYPIGKFVSPASFDRQDTERNVLGIELLPSQLSEELKDVTQPMLSSTYRPGGWNLRQVVHHLADSHINGYVRCKLALTEQTPVIKPYDEGMWSELPDVGSLDPTISLQFLTPLHSRWVCLLKSLTDEQWQRSYFHPESGKHFTLYAVAALYDWHGRHHLEHIRICKHNSYINEN